MTFWHISSTMTLNEDKKARINKNEDDCVTFTTQWMISKMIVILTHMTHTFLPYLIRLPILTCPKYPP